jgi:hypothetical protein
VELVEEALELVDETTWPPYTRKVVRTVAKAHEAAGLMPHEFVRCTAQGLAEVVDPNGRRPDKKHRKHDTLWRRVKYLLENRVLEAVDGELPRGAGGSMLRVNGAWDEWIVDWAGGRPAAIATLRAIETEALLATVVGIDSPLISRPMGARSKVSTSRSVRHFARSAARCDEPIEPNLQQMLGFGARGSGPSSRDPMVAMLTALMSRLLDRDVSAAPTPFSLDPSDLSSERAATTSRTPHRTDAGTGEILDTDRPRVSAVFDRIVKAYDKPTLTRFLIPAKELEIRSALARLDVDGRLDDDAVIDEACRRARRFEDKRSALAIWSAITRFLNDPDLPPIRATVEVDVDEEADELPADYDSAADIARVRDLLKNGPPEPGPGKVEE